MPFHWEGKWAGPRKERLASQGFEAHSLFDALTTRQASRLLGATGTPPVSHLQDATQAPLAIIVAAAWLECMISSSSESRVAVLGTTRVLYLPPASVAGAACGQEGSFEALDEHPQLAFPPCHA